MQATDQIRSPSSGDRWPRRRRVSIVALGLFVISCTLLVFVLKIVLGTPEPGPFYTPPEPLPEGPPGTLIRTEPLETTPAGATGWRVLYLSTDPYQQPVAVSGIVLAPVAPLSPEGRPVVAWAHPTTGVMPNCAPSLMRPAYTLIPNVSSLLQAGYIVVATDYPGLGTPSPHPYLVGESEGRAVLDSVRAVHALAIGANDQYGVWGHSQGGHAVLFAGQLAGDYMPEYDLLGVAAAAPATDLTDLLATNLGRSAGSLFIAQALVAWDMYYPEVSIEDVVKPEYVDRVRRIGERCVVSLDVLGSLGLSSGLDEDFMQADPFITPPWPELLAENTPDGPIAAPILLLQGTADFVIRPAITADYAETRCTAGEEVELRWYRGIEHLAIGEVSAGTVREWFSARINGEPVQNTCH